MKRIMTLLLVMFALGYCELPVNKVFRGVPTDISSYLFEQNASVPRFQIYEVARRGEDTTVTTKIFTKKSFIESINISVDTTVTSQGDTVYFKLFIGADKVLDQKTSAFKAVGGYTFTPLVKYTSSANSYLYWAVTNTTSGQTSGITAGRFKVAIKYFIP
jgi:hypothetical protein